MAREVVWTETAWRDLEHTADYIAQDSPGYAASFVRRIRDRARTLSELSYRGRMVPELGEPRVRELLIGNYQGPSGQALLGCTQVRSRTG